MTDFFTSTVPAHRALPKCKHGQSAPVYNYAEKCTQRKNIWFKSSCSWPKGLISLIKDTECATSLDIKQKIQ